MPSRPVAFRGADVALAGERWDASGEARGTVVLLHGGGQTRHSWGATARRVAADGWNAVALDLRGHGDSEWHRDGDYSLDAFEADLVSFAETLDEPPVLVGASLGGIAALITVGRHPGLARGLVLVDVVIEVEEAGVARIREFMTARPEGFGSLEEVADAVMAYNPLRPRPRRLDGLRKNVRLGHDGRWRWHWDPAFAEAGNEMRRRADLARIDASVAAVTVPTLIVRGLQSDVVSDAGVADMLRRIPTARAVDVSAAGHMVAGDDNEVFGDALVAFLADLG